MNSNLLILGAGQYGQVAKEIAESMGCFEKIDFLDDHSEIAIDKLGNYEMYSQEYSYAIVAIGNADIRLEYIRKLEEALFKIAILVSPRAYVSPSAQLMKGTIVEPMAVVNANAVVEIGERAFYQCENLNGSCAGAIVNHNVTVGDGCLLQCGSIVAAGTLMKMKKTLGYNEVLRDSDVPIGKCTQTGSNYKLEDGCSV